jgi:hypothetical protein
VKGNKFNQNPSHLDKELSQKLKNILKKYSNILRKMLCENEGYIVLAQLKEKLEKTTGESFSVFKKFNITKLKQFLVLLQQGES